MISFKKIASIIAVCMAVVLSIPAVPAFAANNFELHIKTITSVDGYYSDSDIQSLQKRLTSYNPSTITSAYNISAIYDAMESYVAPTGGNYDKYYVSLFPSSGFLLVTEINSDVVENAFLCAGNDQLPSSSLDMNNLGVNARFYYKTTSVQGYWHRESTYTFSTHSWSYDNGSTSSSSYFNNYQVTNCLYLDGNIPMYCKWDVIHNGGTYSEDINFYNSDKSAFTDFLSQNLPYEDQNGNIVTPSGGELEVSQQLGFRKFDSQVIYNQSNSSAYSSRVVWEVDPTGFDLLESLSGWYMHFDVQVNYQVDKIHASKRFPDDSIVGSFTFGGDMQFDGTEGGTTGLVDSIKANSIVIDPADFDNLYNSYCSLGGTSVGYWMAVLAAMREDYASGNELMDYYGVIGGSAIEALGQVGSTILGSQLIGAFNELTGSSLPNWAEEYISADYYYGCSNYNITITGTLRNSTYQSLEGTTYCDFISKSTSSYSQGTTPEATQEDPDPQPQLPYQNTNNNPIAPSGYDSNGNMTYVVVNIDNTDNVPSIDGNNNMSYNPTFSPSVNNSTNVDFGIDNVADTLDPLVVQENQSFWNLFNPFKDNAFIEATEDYMGIIPSQLQTIFISSFGILIGLTVYRFIRRG